MIIDCRKLIEHISAELKSFTDVAVLGVSGGADSTLVAILCAEALGADNVYAISMPYDDKDRKTYNRKSEQLAIKLGVNHLLRPVTQIADAIIAQICIENGELISAVNTGNARARARMCILYGLAYSLGEQLSPKRVRVIGTGNLSEGFIGYCTKGGDAIADIFPIGDLYKSEVYQLLDYYYHKAIIDQSEIDKIPTAGLWEGQTDEGELGWTYDDIEKAIRYCMEHYNEMESKTLDGAIEFVWKRHKANLHKLSKPNIIPNRAFCK